MKDILKNIDWRWKAGMLAAAVVVVIFAVRCTMTSISESTVDIAVDESINITPEQIESIKAIGEWEFLSVADEELVDTTRRGIFSDGYKTVMQPILCKGVFVANSRAGLSNFVFMVREN